jgi:hypothetical protein
VAIELLKLEEVPGWFTYPDNFLRAVQSGVYDIGPWQILEGKWLRVRTKGLKKRFPMRELVPFARRLDSDDVACWERASLPAVQVIHDFCAPGLEQRQAFPSFDIWLSAAQDEAKHFDD